MQMNLPRLRPDQSEIAIHPAKVKVVSCGRRFGKTLMAGTILLAVAANGGVCAWVVPSYKNARPLWRFVEQHASDVANINKTALTAIFPGGGRVGIYTADNDVSIRGESFDLVVVDEAAQIKQETYTDAIMPTLADRDGLIYLISTPKGRNWYYHEYLRGLADGKYQAAFTAPSSANPIPQIQNAARLARDRVSDRTYRQEWLAEFVADGAFFVNVETQATASPAPAQAGHEYVIGVDWARSSGGDYTVYSVVDATTRSQANLVRLAGQPFGVQLDRLKRLWSEYNQCQIIAEYNSMGGPLVEQLQEQGLPVVGFTTTAATKHEIITGLELALDRKEITLLNDPTQTGELLSYEKTDRTGIPAYSAPEGMHDDTVIALALAFHGVNSQQWLMM